MYCMETDTYSLPSIVCHAVPGHCTVPLLYLLSLYHVCLTYCTVELCKLLTFLCIIVTKTKFLYFQRIWPIKFFLILKLEHSQEQVAEGEGDPPLGSLVHSHLVGSSGDSHRCTVQTRQ